MNISILVEREGDRYHVYVPSQGATRIPDIHRIRWYSPAYRNRGRDYYSLTHLETGRSLNKVPLTADECDRLLDTLMECPIEWDQIVDGWTARRYYADRLTTEAEDLAGRY